MITKEEKENIFILLLNKHNLVYEIDLDDYSQLKYDRIPLSFMLILWGKWNLSER